MIYKHVISLDTEYIKLDDIYYIIKEANKVGLFDRKINTVIFEEDDDSTEVFFLLEDDNG